VPHKPDGKRQSSSFTEFHTIRGKTFLKKSERLTKSVRVQNRRHGQAGSHSNGREEEDMDPITGAIVAALAAGVASGATEVGKKVIVDAYDALKAALKGKFGIESNIAKAVADLEADPDFEPNHDALAGRVAQAKAAEDAELRELAQALIDDALAGRVAQAKAAEDAELQELAQALIDALESTAEGKKAVGKYQIDARGAQIGVLGDDAEVKGGIHFGKTEE
jgi:hypothetical protein